MMNSTNLKKRNPILPPDRYFPDGEPHLVGGELYVYPSCDESQEYYCSRQYFVPHTKDMENWTVDGPSFREEQVPWDPVISYPPGLMEAESFDELPGYLKDSIPKAAQLMPFATLKKMIMKGAEAQCLNQSKRCLYAPDAITADGKTALFFCLSDGSEGVAFSDNPAGPFTDPVRITLDTTGEPITGIDPAVFRDDDGRFYLYWGQISSYGAELTPDLLHVRADTIVKGLVTEKDHFFHEGSSMRKIGDTYYYIFADVERGKPTALGYATSKAPLGPFTYQGIIVDNDGCDPATWNNHGSIECLDGQWYVFYHRSTNNCVNLRRMCCEPIEVTADGRIPEVKITSIGAGPRYRIGEGIHAYEACQVSGGAFIRGKQLILPKGESRAEFRYADISPEEKLTIELSGSEGIRVDFRIERDGTIVLIMTADKAGSRLNGFRLKKG